MAVLSEQADGTRKTGRLCVALCGADCEDNRRISSALTDSDLDPKLSEVAGPGELEGAEIGAETIVVLRCDPDLPDQMAALRRARRELGAQPIVVVSPEATGAGVRRALDAGADAIVFRSELEATLAVAVSAVASGQSVVPRELRASVERPAFSHRERQVLEYVTKGLTNAQIAEQLFLSESTIKSHLSSAFSKFGVRSRREAATLFLEVEGLSTPAAVDPTYRLSESSLGGAST